MTNRIRIIGSVGGLILLNSLLAGCGGITADPNGERGGTQASSPMAEKTASAGSMLQNADSQAAPSSSPQQIVIDNFTFSPAKLTVSVGSQITWVNHDDVPHTVTSTDKPKRFDSGAMDTDDQFVHVFATPGTYNYFCAVHPHMTAQIIVK